MGCTFELGEMTELSLSSKGRQGCASVCLWTCICFLKVGSDTVMGSLGCFPRKLQYYHKNIEATY